jgi:hypothetical protein
MKSGLALKIGPARRALPVKRSARISSIIIVSVTLVAAAQASPAQQSVRQRFFHHNATMAAQQPALITPLVAPDPRIVQYVKLSFANQYSSTGTQTVNYGNSRGVGLIAGNRFEFDFIPPPYIQHNSSAIDGFGDAASLVKYRIASGNAQRGDFEITAILNHTFATGSHKNGAASDSYAPMLAGAKAFRHFDIVSSLGGSLPTGHVAAQGRCVTWNAVTQTHLAKPLWLEVESNATFYFGGSHDGKMQNFVTPAAFYVLRRKEWKPTHPFYILNCGMQIATSGFHTYNHNLISELRILF